MPGVEGEANGADDGVGGQRGLELVRLEPAIEDGPRRRGEDLHGARAVGAEPAEAERGAAEPPQVAEAAARTGSGGVSSSVGSMAPAMRSSMAS